MATGETDKIRVKPLSY